MGLLKRKKNVFYLLIKIPNLNLYQNQNSKSMFPDCIDRLGHQKRKTKQQIKKNQGKNKQKMGIIVPTMNHYPRNG